jgi:hypothetical protein
VPLIPVAIGLLIVLGFLALIPLSLVLRYRASTARRLARRWVATVNIGMLALSALLFLFGAAITNIWVAQAFRYSVAGLVAGSVIGVVGLWLSRWEATPNALHYTPNRWLVLALTLVVTSRVLYGFWRGWHAWQSTPEDVSWLAAAGAAGSLAAGAVVIGYYLVYSIGVRRRVTRHEQAHGLRGAASHGGRHSDGAAATRGR